MKERFYNLVTGIKTIVKLLGVNGNLIPNKYVSKMSELHLGKGKGKNRTQTIFHL